MDIGTTAQLNTHPASPLFRMVVMLMRMSVHSEFVSPVQCAAYEPEPRNEDLRAHTGERGRLGMGFRGGLRVGLGSGWAWDGRVGTGRMGVRACWPPVMTQPGPGMEGGTQKRFGAPSTR